MGNCCCAYVEKADDVQKDKDIHEDEDENESDHYPNWVYVDAAEEQALTINGYRDPITLSLVTTNPILLNVIRDCVEALQLATKHRGNDFVLDRYESKRLRLSEIWWQIYGVHLNFPRDVESIALHINGSWCFCFDPTPSRDWTTTATFPVFVTTTTTSTSKTQTIVPYHLVAPAQRIYVSSND